MENDNSALWATMLNNKQDWANNPLYLFLFASIFGGRNGFLGYGDGCSLSQQIQDNHNSDYTMGAIKENASSIAGLADAFKSCCCENRLGTQKAGYENIINNLQQTNAIQAGFANTNGILAKGFSDIGYAAQAQTCELKTNQNENTQRIIDTMNAHWNADLQQRYNDVRLEMSQLKQNETLIAALKTTA